MREFSEPTGIASKGRLTTSSGKDFPKVNANPDQSGNRDPDVLAGLLGPTNRRRGHGIALDDGDVNGDSNQIDYVLVLVNATLMNDTEGIIYVSNQPHCLD